MTVYRLVLLFLVMWSVIGKVLVSSVHGVLALWSRTIHPSPSFDTCAPNVGNFTAISHQISIARWELVKGFWVSHHEIQPSCELNMGEILFFYLYLVYNIVFSCLHVRWSTSRCYFHAWSLAHVFMPYPCHDMEEESWLCLALVWGNKKLRFSPNHACIQSVFWLTKKKKKLELLNFFFIPGLCSS